MSATRLKEPILQTKTDLSERAQSRQNTTSNPGTVLPLRRREDLDPHILHRESLDFM